MCFLQNKNPNFLADLQITHNQTTYYSVDTHWTLPPIHSYLSDIGACHILNHIMAFHGSLSFFPILLKKSNYF